jgi:hypothetical protein
LYWNNTLKQTVLGNESGTEYYTATRNEVVYVCNQSSPHGSGSSHKFSIRVYVLPKNSETPIDLLITNDAG